MKCLSFSTAVVLMVFGGVGQVRAAVDFEPMGNGVVLEEVHFEIAGDRPGEILWDSFPPTYDDLVPGDYDQLYVFGNEVGKPHRVGVTFTGTMEVELIEGFMPQAGQDFHLVVCGPFLVKGIPPMLPDKEYVAGTIARGPDFELTLPPLGDGLVWVWPWWVQAPWEEVGGMEFDGLTISVIPEPGTLVLLATGGLCLLAYVRRKRRGR